MPSVAIAPIVGTIGEMNTPVVDSSHTAEYQRAATLIPPPSTPARVRRARHEERDRKAQNKSDNSLKNRSELRSADEVLLQQVVGNGRLDLDAGKQRVERRRHHLPGSQGGRADEHNLVLNVPVGTRPLKTSAADMYGNVCFVPR